LAASAFTTTTILSRVKEKIMIDAFLKIEGVDGESTDTAHAGWIELQSFSWGISQAVSGSVSSQGSLSASRADFQNFSASKYLDKASSILAQDCASGKHYTKATVQLHRAGESKELFQEYIFTDVMLTNYSIGGSNGSDIPAESLALTYGKVEWKYVPTKVAGGKGSGSVPGSWNLTTNAKS